MKEVNITLETSMEQAATFMQACTGAHSVAVMDQNKEVLLTVDGVVFGGCAASTVNGIPTVTVTLHDETSDIVARLDALEETQGAQDDAIADLGEAVSNIVEG